MNYVTYDATGKLTGAYLQDLLPEHEGAYIEVSEDVRLNWLQYLANDARDGVEAAPVEAPAPNREQLKAARQAAVDAITVTVGDKVFDGDETSQGRMARALRVAEITGQTSCTWVLHDNTAATVTRDELAQALALAMQAQGELWVIPA